MADEQNPSLRRTWPLKVNVRQGKKKNPNNAYWLCAGFCLNDPRGGKVSLMLLRATQSVSSHILSDQRGNTTTLVDGWWAGVKNERIFFAVKCSLHIVTAPCLCGGIILLAAERIWYFVLGQAKYLGLLQWLEVWIAKLIMSFLNGSGSHKSTESHESVLNPFPKRVGLLNFLFSLLGNYCVFLWELCRFGSRFQAD